MYKLVFIKNNIEYTYYGFRISIFKILCELINSADSTEDYDVIMCCNLVCRFTLIWKCLTHYHTFKVVN